MREDVKNTRCQENLKRVGMALRMYCSDFDDHLPPADAWCDATRKYMGLEELRCPMMPRAKSGYAFNIDLDSVRRSEPDEEKTRLCFDGGGGNWNRSGTLDIIEARHSGFGNVVYVDGHVKPLYTEDY